VLLTESDLTGTRGTGSKDVSKRMPSRRKNAVDPVQLRTGDTVVHEQHGVARYVEMVQRTVQGATREYLILEFAPSKKGQPGDRVFVPTDQLELVTKYVGGEAPDPRPARRRDWAKRKGRARKAVKDIAAGLIQLYSARMAAPATPSARTPRGSASSRTPSRTSRRPTSSRRSPRSRRTWRSRSRWTG
jgi:transcription-repair coupling factor (superfamily II helicase)